MKFSLSTLLFVSLLIGLLFIAFWQNWQISKLVDGQSSIANQPAQQARTAKAKNEPYSNLDAFGVTPQLIELELEKFDKGLRILSVQDHSLASMSGIENGDIILEFGGVAANSIELIDEIVSNPLRRSRKVLLLRNGQLLSGELIE